MPREQSEKTIPIDLEAALAFVRSKKIVADSIIEAMGKKRATGVEVAGYIISGSVFEGPPRIQYNAGRFVDRPTPETCDPSVVAGLMLDIVFECSDETSSFRIQRAFQFGPISGQDPDPEYPENLYYELRPDYSRFPLLSESGYREGGSQPNVNA